MSNATPDGPVERYLYDPYGRVMVLKEDWTPQQVAGHDHGTVSAFGNEILFTGYRWNPAPAPGMGTYHARNREYHPLLGRFMQRDPLGYVDGGNLYAGYFAMWGGVDPMGTRTMMVGSGRHVNLATVRSHGNLDQSLTDWETGRAKGSVPAVDLVVRNLLENLIRQHYPAPDEVFASGTRLRLPELSQRLFTVRIGAFEIPFDFRLQATLSVCCDAEDVTSNRLQVNWLADLRGQVCVGGSVGRNPGILAHWPSRADVQIEKRTCPDDDVRFDGVRVGLTGTAQLIIGGKVDWYAELRPGQPTVVDVDVESKLGFRAELSLCGYGRGRVVGVFTLPMY